MRAVRDRAEARWLPSRFRYAIFRILAYVVLRKSRPKRKCGLVLVIDRDQSAWEYYLIAIWMLATVTCYTAAVLAPFTNRAIAATAALPVASIAIKFPLYIGGVTALALKAIGIGKDDVRRVNSIFTYAVLIIAASYFVTVESWVHYVAISFLLIVAANGAAALILWLLRSRIAELEASYGLGA